MVEILDTRQKQLFDKIKDHYSLITLITLIIITSILTYYKIQVQVSIGPQWDTFDFLSNAIYFSGNGFGYVDFIRPPFLSFLTSLFFRLGYVSEVTIFAIDGFLFAFGVIGIYLLLKFRFNSHISFLGALFYISFPVILLWVGSGYTDIASTSFSIWFLYFIILAVKRNSKYFYLAFPFLMLAFLTRFSSALLIFPLIFYLLANKKILSEYKSILGGLFLSIALIMPILLSLWQSIGNAFLTFFNFYGSSSAPSSAVRFAYNPDLFYYFKNAIYCFINMDFLNSSYIIVFFAFIAIEIVILYLILMGITIYLHNMWKSLKINKSCINHLKSKKYTVLKAITTIALLILFLITLNSINYLLSDLIFLIFSYTLYNLMKISKLDNLDLDFLFIVWFMSFLIFSSIYQIKVCRYFIPMAPAIAYFIVVGLNEISVKIKIGKIPLNNILSAFIALILILSIFSFIHQMEKDPISNGINFKLHSNGLENLGKPYSGELYLENYNTLKLKDISKWLEEYDSNYKTKIIYSDYFWPHLSWYLQTPVRSLTNEERINANELLMERNVTYYIAMFDIDLKDYKKIAQFKTNFGSVIIYQYQIKKDFEVH